MKLKLNRYKIIINSHNGSWYIALKAKSGAIINGININYLHRDGKIYPHCGPKGFFASREEAQCFIQIQNNRKVFLPDELFEI